MISWRLLVITVILAFLAELFAGDLLFFSSIAFVPIYAIISWFVLRTEKESWAWIFVGIISAVYGIVWQQNLGQILLCLVGSFAAATMLQPFLKQSSYLEIAQILIFFHLYLLIYVLLGSKFELSYWLLFTTGNSLITLLILGLGRRFYLPRRTRAYY